MTSTGFLDRLAPIVIAAASLTATAKGQSTTLATDTVVGVYAAEGLFGAPPSHRSIAAGTPIASSRSLAAALTTASASLTITSMPLGMHLRETGSASRNPSNPFVVCSSGTARDTPSREPHSFVWTLRNRGAGRIDVALNGSSSDPFMVLASVTIDVGADGSNEVQQTMSSNGTNFTTSIPVSFLADLPVRVTAHAGGGTASLAHNPAYTIDLTLQYVPQVQSATFTSYGSGCGPVLTATDTPLALAHRLQFAMTGGLPNAFSAFVFGTQRISTPLLGTNCLLLTDPVANVFGTTTPAGAATFAMDLPGPIPVADVQVQAISFDFTPRVLSTQGVEVKIRD